MLSAIASILYEVARSVSALLLQHQVSVILTVLLTVLQCRLAPTLHTRYETERVLCVAAANAYKANGRE
jgi:hypothetical protein